MVYFENNKFKYWRSTFLREHMVYSKYAGTKRKATDEQVKKLAAVLEVAQHIPWPNNISQFEAEQKIYIAFCLTVHYFDPPWQVFMTQEPTAVALTFGSMPRY